MRALLPFLLMMPGLANAADCEHSPEALVRYEREVLGSDTASKMAAPLACMLEIHEKAEGMDRYFAASYLKTLLGGGQISGVMKDARYQRVADALEILTEKSDNPLYESVIAEFSRGDWRAYQLFCEQGNTDYCSVFMPDEESVKKQSPLLAAASLLRLKNAYTVLNGKQRKEIGERIKKLYREIPVAQKLQRKFIDQIYNELFPPSLSQA